MPQKTSKPLPVGSHQLPDGTTIDVLKVVNDSPLFCQLPDGTNIDVRQISAILPMKPRVEHTSGSLKLYSYEIILHSGYKLEVFSEDTQKLEENRNLTKDLMWNSPVHRP